MLFLLAGFGRVLGMGGSPLAVRLAGAEGLLVMAEGAAVETGVQGVPPGGALGVTLGVVERVCSAG